MNILSSLIKYEKQKKKIEDFNVQSIWENKTLNYKNFKKLHSFGRYSLALTICELFLDLYISL